MFGFESTRHLTNFLSTSTKIASFLVQASSSYFLNSEEIKKRLKGMALTQSYSRTVLKKMGFEVQVKGIKPDFENNNYFMVCNHMSYLDILVLSSVHPAMFVTSVEMENTMLLGELAKLGGSYFVERRNKAKLTAEIQDLANLLKKGINVFVFPEGTSTSGQEVLRFKRALFQSAVLAEKEVLPICLKYETIDGEKFSVSNADKVCWYGDMDFFPHMKGVMNLKKVEVSIEFLEPISTRDKTKEELAEITENLVRQAYFK